MLKSWMRKQYTATFKARVVQELLKEEEPLRDFFLSTKYVSIYVSIKEVLSTVNKSCSRASRTTKTYQA